MKTKVYWLTLLASAAIVSQTQAHGFGGGGAGFGGGHVGGAHFSSGPTGYSGPRFSSVGGMRYPNVTQFHPRVVNSNVGSSVAARQSTRESINRGNDVARFSNTRNRTSTNTQHIRSGVEQVRNGNNTLRFGLAEPRLCAAFRELAS